MPTDTPTAPGLPPLCFTRLPSSGETIAILRGEAGYHPIVTFLTPEQLNAALLVPPTADHVQAMLAGSLFGWRVPAADPAHYACAKHDGGSGAIVAPLPQYPVVAAWGAPDTPFRMVGQAAIHPGPSPELDRLWTYAGGVLGYYGWLCVANQHARQVFSCGILDLPPRDWRGEYAGRVPPDEAADIAIDEYAAQHGTGPVATAAPEPPDA